MNTIATARPPRPMLAKPYRWRDPTGWLLSEKLDGVRAIFHDGEFWSRNGNRFAAPGWFRAGFPAGLTLDGELYLGRWRFNECVGLVRSKEADWSGLRFHVFDMVGPGRFEERLERLRGLHLPRHAELVAHVECTGPRHLARVFEEITSAGGEGVMLRNPASGYSHFRSANLLKLKE